MAFHPGTIVILYSSRPCRISHWTSFSLTKAQEMRHKTHVMFTTFERVFRAYWYTEPATRRQHAGAKRQKEKEADQRRALMLCFLPDEAILLYRYCAHSRVVAGLLHSRACR